MIAFLEKHDTKTKSVIQSFIVPFIVFLSVAFLLTFNVITLPSLVIGDNFQWTPQNVLDITGPKVVRESYMGDIAVLSAFKTGFLFPLTYFLVSISLPSTLVYPFLLYFLSLLSFYFLSKEFLKNESLRVLVSLLYLINPVTPYYFASLINAFSLVLLPLGIKFFVRTLKEIEQSTKPAIFKNFILTALFLGLCVSANEQLVFSVLLITLFILVTFAVFLHKKYKILVISFKAFLFNMTSFGLVFVFVNIPLFVSIANIQKASWATYFQGHSTSRFLATVEYTYRNVDLNTLLRLGGDSGTGLGQSSWYDSFLLTNLFGYVLLILFILSILILAFKKDVFPKIRLFFYQIVILFIFTLILLLFMKNLPNSTNVLGTPIDLFLETWESPSKLRVILLVSLLTVTFVIFSKLEFFARKRKNKLIVGVAVTLVLLSTFIYNSPWLINYGGKTTLQEVTDVTKGGDLYNERYVNATRLLGDQGSNGRGIIMPYTHETELYASPNSRIFQIVSQINQQTSELVSEKNVQWSKTLGLFSIKTVAVMNYFNLGEGLIFPDAADIDVNSALTEIRNDSGFKTISQNNDFTLMDNQNALPLLYASSHYVFFDSIGSLKYAFNFVDFKDLPVFLQSGNSNGISIPSFVNEGNYKLYALSLAQEQSSSNLTLSINNLNDTREVMLNNTNDFQNLPVYSAMSTLSSGDMVKVSTPSINQTQSLEDVTLNSTSTTIGTFGSFTLDFNVNILENGNYSFLGPRVLIDDGNETYFIIIQDNGVLELATQQNNVFNSAMISRFVGYKLLDPTSSVKVKVVRDFDEVKVYIQNDLYMTFTTAPKVAKIYLASEKSASAFSKINVTRESSVKLFAVRQNITNPEYDIHLNDPEQSSMTVHSNGSDFAVVSQYLYTQLRNVNNGVKCDTIQANIFFKGWVFNSYNLASSETYVSIGTDNQWLTLGLTGFSVVFSYMVIILSVTPVGKRVKFLWGQFIKIDKNEE